ncbi:hypothetical protein CAP48_17555 [Advenella sp. S44]|nr:hypothetical protein CAP48_17555 [Advenella sp. S44]
MTPDIVKICVVKGYLPYEAQLCWPNSVAQQRPQRSRTHEMRPVLLMREPLTWQHARQRPPHF